MVFAVLWTISGETEGWESLGAGCAMDSSDGEGPIAGLLLSFRVVRVVAEGWHWDLGTSHCLWGRKEGLGHRKHSGRLEEGETEHTGAGGLP